VSADRLISSGGPWEEVVGYSRAVVAGPWVLVAGSTSTVDGEVVHEGDAYAQTLEAFEVVRRALVQAGLDLVDVVRTRMYLKDIGDQDAVGRAHGELFGAIRPAATMVAVSGFVDPRMLVEVEVDAYRTAVADR
jgi:enamine deaminase RidA (YjgF/YER057c/UK114 family)